MQRQRDEFFLAERRLSLPREAHHARCEDPDSPNGPDGGSERCGSNRVFWIGHVCYVTFWIVPQRIRMMCFGSGANQDERRTEYFWVPSELRAGHV
eukprot:906002-Amorphochlora_amoeboformis.AAC.2